MNAKYNPFNPNSVVTTNLFAGRSKYILDILKKLEQVKRGMPSSFFMYGERGIGKTALSRLIKYISSSNNKDLGQLNFLTSYYTIEKGQHISSVLQSSINDLSDQLSQGVAERLTSKLGGLFRNGKFNIGAFGFTAGVELTQEEKLITLKDQMVSILSNIIDGIHKEQNEEDKKDGILIVIDEMDNILDVMHCAQLFRGITTTLNVKDKGYVSFLLIGYEHTYNDFFSGDESARRTFDKIKLDVMPSNEAVEVLTKGFNEIELDYDEELLKKKIFVAGGYPHAIQIIGHNLVEVDNDRIIDDKDWEEVIPLTAEELSSKDFAALYKFDGKSTGREEIMNILALAPNPLSIQEIKKFSKLQNVYPYIKKLEENNSIRYVDDKKIELHSHLFKTAIILHLWDRIYENKSLFKVLNEFYPSKDGIKKINI